MTPLNPTTDAEYFGSTALRSSQVMLMRRSPATFEALKDDKAKETDALAFGRLLHALVLEGPKVVRAKFLVCGEGEDGPVNPKTGKMYGRDTKAFDEWIAENSNGRTPISAAEWAKALIMAERIAALPDNPLTTQFGVAEHRAVRVIEGHECQCKPDWITDAPVLLDVKTCPDIRWFPSDARKYGYVGKMAHYMDVLDEPSIQCVLLAVEKEQPHAAQLFWIPPSMIETEIALNRAALRRITECTKSGVWPTDCEKGVWLDE